MYEQRVDRLQQVRVRGRVRGRGRGRGRVGVGVGAGVRVRVRVGVRSFRVACSRLAASAYMRSCAITGWG